MGVAGQHHAPAALPPGKTRYPLYKRLGGPQGRSGRVRKISPLPGFDPRTVQAVANRYTDWAIPAAINFCIIILKMSVRATNDKAPCEIPVSTERPFRLHPHTFFPSSWLSNIFKFYTHINNTWHRSVTLGASWLKLLAHTIAAYLAVSEV